MLGLYQQHNLKLINDDKDQIHQPEADGREDNQIQ